MVRRVFFTFAIVAPLALVAAHLVWPGALWGFVIVAPIVYVGIVDVVQRRHSLRRVYPVIGRGRYLMESIRPEIQQYFVESNTNGTPYSREFRSMIYQRAKGERDTVPFGTERDVGRIGYEWLTHSLHPQLVPEREPRVLVGGPKCKQPYAASHLNISAMSYGSLSRQAVLALNEGAKRGGFAHNTGEGGISPYHLERGADLIWQVGTGYFGCRTRDGHFDPEAFKDRAQLPAVKMIELKLSQGAKPGHGGILPAGKVTAEIASIRGVPIGQAVLSPPAHSAFETPLGLLEFVARLRDLSGGKPIGFKLCVGHRTEFLAICKAMLATGIRPDFITVDGSEGGTGAAPIELSNSVGMPLRDGLLFVNSALRGISVRPEIKLIGAGKVSSAFHMVRTLALGADLCNAARAMMFALGCIQARRCNSNDCPVGVATQDPARAVGIDVETKARRVHYYHKRTIHAFLELIASNGLESPDQLGPGNVLRRVDATTIKPFSEIYEYLPAGCLLHEDSVPDGWRDRWRRADPRTFKTGYMSALRGSLTSFKPPG